MKSDTEKTAFWLAAALPEYIRANKVIVFLSVIICLLLALVLRLSANRVYKVDSVIGLSQLAQPAGVSFSKEAQQIGINSKKVLQKAIEKSPLLVSYEMQNGNETREMYADDAPVRIEVSRILPEAYGRKISLVILDQKTALVNGLGKSGKYDLNAMIYTAPADFRIVLNKEIYAQKELLAQFNDPDNLAADYARKLKIKPDVAKKQITLSVTDPHPQKSIDLLNTLNSLYANIHPARASSRKMNALRDSISLLKNELYALAAPKKTSVKEAPEKRLIKAGRQQMQALAALQTYLGKPFENFTLLPAYDTKDRFLNNAVLRFNDLQQRRTVAANKDPFDAELRVMRQKMIDRIRKINDPAKPQLVNQQPLSLSHTDARIKYAKEALLARLNREEDSLRKLAAGPAVQILKEPSVHKAGSAFEATLLYLGAVFLGLVLPMPIVYARNAFTKNVLSLRDIQALTNVPVAGIFSHHKVQAEKASSSIADYGRYKYEWSLLIRQIETAGGRSTGTVVLFSSAGSGEGKSYLAQHLSLMLAMKDKRVVFVDLNIIDNENGEQAGVVNFILQKKLDAESLLQASSKSDKLFFISSGYSEKKQVYNDLPFYQWEVGKQERGRIKSPRVKQLICQLKKSFDYVVLDTPSVLHDPFADAVYPLGDIRLQVVRYNYTRKVTLQNFRAPSAKTQSTWLVFNDIRHTSPQFYKALHQNKHP